MEGMSQVARFSIYSLDLVTLELRRKGQRCALQEQSARVLAVLLSPPGDLVTRERLREELWPDTAYFDYEHAINKAISQIRKALGDDSRSCRFIETVPRQGYRFCGDAHMDAAASVERTVEPISMKVLSGTEHSVPARLVVAEAVPVEGTEVSVGATSAWKRYAFLSVAICVLVLIGLFAARHIWRSRAAVSPESPLILGMLPFETESDAAKAIAENLRFDLSDSLGQVPGLQVRAAHSFTTAPRDNASMRSLASTAGLDVILLGRLEVNGTNCLLHFEVVRAKDNSHIADLSFVGNVNQLHSLRDRVQYAVYTTLGGKPGTLQHIQQRTANPEAYEAYLDGRHYLQARTDDSLNHAMDRFQHAAALDPKFASAYAGMANVYLIFADRGEIPNGFDMAQRLANKALSIDQSSAQAHAILGCTAQSRGWDSVTAERELRLAVDLDSGEAVYHIWLATLLSIQGKADESLQQIALAESDDPFWPPVYQAAAFVAANAGKNQLMLADAGKMVELTPRWPIAADQLAWAFWYSHRYSDAIAEWQRMAQLSNDADRLALEAAGEQAFSKGGATAYAKVRLAALNTKSGHNYHDKTIEQAEWNVYAEQPGRALEILSAMVQEHDPAAITMAVDPAFVSLHTDGRFLDLLQRVGLPNVVPIESKRTSR
ncbi:transcriptional regulator, CadC (plasmid) [Granulicella tundricola MP5ACTX9]|uniref:Transcriptional regulator, CadC n=2 Tax=Granulicella TaxID=940557 RepID=E8X706_GRATM|nr:transcriptional regulator, CadC [Granulicella tundricola MP5ACTX9]